MIKELSVPLVSVSQLKKSPQSVVDEAKETQNGVYVLNNNSVMMVVMDPETYKTLVDIQTENKELQEKLKQAEMKQVISEMHEAATDNHVEKYSNIDDAWASLITKEEYDELPD
jgi:PHD/YefM family antitoxin component YafN of YafNO toxin-antitoxin module